VSGKFCCFLYGYHGRKYKRKKPSGYAGRLIYIGSLIAYLIVEA